MNRSRPFQPLVAMGIAAGTAAVLATEAPIFSAAPRMLVALAAVAMAGALGWLQTALSRLRRTHAASEAELSASRTREVEVTAMKRDFVSLVSHEFRTPLGTIMSATEVLQRYFDRLEPARRERHLEMIFRSTRTLASLVEEVLLLGQVEAGRLQFVPAPLPLAAFCRDLVEEMRGACEKPRTIHFSALGNLEAAVGDDALLRPVLTQLLANACTYSDPWSEVTLELERADSDVVIRVRDQGIGIPPEDQARVFRSFTRGGNVGERPGTGLGLVIVRHCVELHGGTLQLRSELGWGTEVTVRLPMFAECRVSGGECRVAERLA